MTKSKLLFSVVAFTFFALVAGCSQEDDNFSDMTVSETSNPKAPASDSQGGGTGNNPPCSDC